jgi:NADPH2:quinone reductase
MSDEERAALCRSLGAEATVIHGDRPIAAALRQLTGGRGVDLVYDPGGGSMSEGAASALARKGACCPSGLPAGSGRVCPLCSWS